MALVHQKGVTSDTLGYRPWNQHIPIVSSVGCNKDNDNYGDLVAPTSKTKKTTR